jgi:hypothetical protein
MHWKTSANVVGEGCRRKYQTELQSIQVTEKNTKVSIEEK